MHRTEDRSLIHASAIVDPSARIAADVVVGAGCVIGPDVEIDAGCWIAPHVVIQGPTRIGRDNRVHAFAAIGGDPQDKKYDRERTRLEIGDRNTIREYVTINRGTEQGGGVTRVGDDNWIMAYVHIAHDCRVGNGTVLANNATLAGHVEIGDHAILGGATLVHQFCRIGSLAFTAYGSRINKDVPPFVRVSEGRARPRGLNTEGLKRHGFPAGVVGALKEAYRILYRSGLPLEEAMQRLAEPAGRCAEVARLRHFLESSTRSIVR